MILTTADVEEILSAFFRRAQAARNAGGISMKEVAEGTPVPDGWKLDSQLAYFLPPGVVLF